MNSTIAARLRTILDSARALARSGAHEDHQTITTELQYLADSPRARRWLADRRFLAQLDKLCAEARGASRDDLDEQATMMREQRVAGARKAAERRWQKKRSTSTPQQT